MKNIVLKTLVLFLFAVLGIFSMQKVEAEVIYEGYKISKQDITGASVPFIYVKSSDGEVENVYCFNLRLTYPPTQWEGTNYPKYKKEEANSNQMDRLASNKRLSGDELRDAILKVIYYGDSENGNRELQKNIISPMYSFMILLKKQFGILQIWQMQVITYNMML
ncbi:Fibronectin-binding protein signal sequence [Streptococcus dysgalactiae subsp. equisimilis]|uniref:Cys-Gln thioester bond-forming surface protein n=1 Tax=Streptococcus dysgalactiae TaxID=1334 RepID=UPI000DA28FEA|nr:Cys-Gln thioester bond-forming surface protein [Streptococcus dysgalactiae]MBM6540118.1 Cys-Gln thioester bond-forming surface protein [Streptococcus dysgalactiae subsp. equisimilis]SQF70001.1 Fibronectin-binding protein signal sequence [Streptococcus dysgalactiae subsp. equisimilis]SQF79299.1 Fibronectin-binding protein signal sequence [Streptococcus dysgalactiae subsp. equisimilis]